MKVLIVLTNHGKIGDHETGFHFSEFSHPYEFFTGHGYEVIVASPNGGECPITSPHPEDKINAQFYADPAKMRIVQETAKLDELRHESFDAVYVAGGHGTMFDLPNNDALGFIMRKTYEGGGVLAAVCHGPAAFVGAKSDDGTYLVSGKRINSFTNSEEKATLFYKDVPFLLESKLIEQGAVFESSGPRQPHLSVDSHIVTGQNPESIELVTGAIHALVSVR